jgi:hypothetical protein
LIAIRLCERLGLDYPTLYEKAYSWRIPPGNADWLRNRDWSDVEAETVVPPVSEKTLRNLLYDLNDINNRSICETLEKEFERLGYKVAEWWNADKED